MEMIGAVRRPVRRLAFLLAVCGRSAAATSNTEVLVFGHKSPDTDAISAAVTYAWELGERGIAAKAFRLGDLNPETTFVLKSLGVEQPPLLPGDGIIAPDTKVAVVDTNNPAELPNGISKADIHSIVDHHKLSGLTNAAPLEVDIRPLCSSGSILYARAKAAGRKPPPKIAGLMLSSILSDSLGFRSPTTTDTDRAYAKELAKLASLDIDRHLDGMMEAKAQISGFTPEELVLMDSKVFTLGGKQVRVSVVETPKPSVPLALKDQLVVAMGKIRREQTLDEVLLFVVDIMKEEATFISASPAASKLVGRAWKASMASDGTTVLPGVMSRKKQIIPALERAASVLASEEL